jgi:ABC-type Fe3+ transport system permease subunit
MNVEVNYLAVGLATLSSMVVGSIWYAKSVFGNQWMKLAKVKLDNKKGAAMWVPLVVTLVVSLITAYVLAHVSFLSHKFFGNTFLQDSVTTAFWLWLGLTAARIVTHDAFEGRPWKLTLLTVSHELVTLLVMGLIIGYMGLPA